MPVHGRASASHTVPRLPRAERIDELEVAGNQRRVVADAQFQVRAEADTVNERRRLNVTPK
jgi:hypothetical protein